MKIPVFINAEERKPVVFAEEEVAESLEGWKGVLAEHPGAFEEEWLEEISTYINEWNQKLFSKQCNFSHGDFHFENILQDAEGNIKVLDWQNCGAGHVSGDISFFLSRLSADGYVIDTKEVIDMYCKCSNNRGISVKSEEIEIQMCLANLNTSFRYWHYYLHDSTKERVRNIYDKMVEDGKILSNPIETS
jgi:thiamine kinase-like enzyme